MRSRIEFDELDGYQNGNCAFSIDTLGLRVAAQQREAPFNKPDLHIEIASFPLQGRFAHELDHLFRSVSTSWGLLCHVLLCRSLYYYIRILSECDLQRELGSRQFAEIVREIRQGGENAECVRSGDQLAARLYVFSREYEVRRALMGYPPFGPMDSLGETMSKLWGLNDVPTDIEHFFPHPPNERFRDQAISAASVLEGLGILKESVFAVDSGEARDAEVLNKAATQYTFALSFARDLLIDLFDWEYQPAELEAALNLALWPPFEPNGLWQGKGIGWQDVEVGYRFCRIIGWLRRRAKPLTSHDSLTNDQRDQLFRSFFDDACKAFGWPSPFHLANAWQAHLDKSMPWTRTKYFWWCLGERRLRTNGAIHMLTEFTRSPYMSWFTSSSSEERSRPSFNFIRYEDKIEIHEQHCDPDGKTLSARLESYAFLGMLLVLGYRAFRPADRPEDAETLDQHLRVMPKFVDPGPGQEMATRNCQYLRDLLL